MQWQKKIKKIKHLTQKITVTRSQGEKPVSTAVLTDEKSSSSVFRNEIPSL